MIRLNQWGKRLLLISALLCPFALVPPVRAIEPIGDNGELFITGVATVAENDNIYLSHASATSATICDFTPGLLYEFGKNQSLISGQFAASEDFQYYSAKGGNGRLNNQLTNITFLTNYDDVRNKFHVDASFHNADQPEVGLQNLGFLVDRNVINAAIKDEVSITEKSSISGGVGYGNTDYKAAGFADWQYVELPVNYYYKVEPKLDLSAGFRFRNNTLGAGGIDSRDYYYNVGARGEFSPNLTGEFTVGYDRASFDLGKTTDSLGANASFTYAYDAKTSVRFGYNDDYGYSATTGAYQNYGPFLSVGTSLSDQWSVSGQIAYNHYAYVASKQADNFYSFQAGLSYIVSVHISISASYSYAKDDSNVTGDNFNNNIFSVSASVRF